MEVPDLSVSTILSLKSKLSVVDQVNIFVRSHLWDNIERSFNIKAKLFIEFSFSWFSLPFISVDDVPLLVKLIVLGVYTNVSVLLVNITYNFHNFWSLIDNSGTSVSEELPPSWVGSGTSEIAWSTVALDIKRMSLPKIILDSLWDSIEVPLLSHGILSPSSKVDIIGTNALSDSLHRKSGSNIEWSVDIESPVFVHSLSLGFLCFIEIDNSPSLLWLVGFTQNTYSLSLSILSVLDIEALTSSGINVAESICFIFEDLEPLGVSRPDLHVVCSTWVLNVPRLVVQSCLDSQWFLIEVPNLSLSSIWSLDYHVSVVDEIKVSVSR
jgi:hypothetical protein